MRFQIRFQIRSSCLVVRVFIFVPPDAVVSIRVQVSGLEPPTSNFYTPFCRMVFMQISTCGSMTTFCTFVGALTKLSYTWVIQKSMAVWQYPIFPLGRLPQSRDHLGSFWKGALSLPCRRRAKFIHSHRYSVNYDAIHTASRNAAYSYSLAA